MTKKTVLTSVTVLDVSEYHYPYEKFINAMDATLSKIETPTDLSISFGYDEYNDSTEISLSYKTLETDEQYATRIKREASNIGYIEAAERKKLAELISKYGVPK